MILGTCSLGTVYQICQTTEEPRGLFQKQLRSGTGILGVPSIRRPRIKGAVCFESDECANMSFGHCYGFRRIMAQYAGWKI